MVQAITSEFAQVPNLRPTQESRNYNLMQNNTHQAVGFQEKCLPSHEGINTEGEKNY